MVIAGLIVFAAFMVNSDRKKEAKLERIKQYVEYSLRCYRSFEEIDTVSEVAEDKSESNDNSKGSDEADDCSQQQAVDADFKSRDIISDFIEKIQLLQDPPKKEAENNPNDTVEDIEFLRQDVEIQLVELKAALPFTSLWVPDFSTTAFDSLTTSGDLYVVSEYSLIEKLTELNLASEHLKLLEHSFQKTITSELSPAIARFDKCQSEQSVPSEGEDLGCSTLLLDRHFVSILERLDKLLVRAFGVKSRMQTIRQEAIASIKPEIDD